MPSYEEKMEAAALADEEAAAQTKKEHTKRPSDRSISKIFMPCPNCGRKFNHLVYSTHVSLCTVQTEMTQLPQLQQIQGHSSTGQTFQLPQNRISERVLNRLDVQAAIQQASNNNNLLPHRHSSGYFSSASFNVAAQAALEETANRQSSETRFAPQQQHQFQGGLLELSQAHELSQAQSHGEKIAKAQRKAHERRASHDAAVKPEQVKSMLSKSDYVKGEWSGSYRSLHAEVDCQNSVSPARKIAKWTLNKLSEDPSITSTNLRQHMVDIVKDTWWCVFLVANMWVRMLCSAVEPTDRNPKQQRILRANQLEPPKQSTSEFEYLYSSFAILRTMRLRRELQRNETVETVWKKVCLPLCVAFAKAIMTEGLGPLVLCTSDGGTGVTAGDGDASKKKSKRKASADELAEALAKEIAGGDSASPITRGRRLSAVSSMKRVNSRIGSIRSSIKMMRSSFKKKNGKESTRKNKLAPQPAGD
jgi:hypothetical protein